MTAPAYSAAAWVADAAAPATAPRLVVGPVEIDLLRHRVTVNGGRVRVTPMQMRLLVHLVRHRDEVVSRASLLRDVWGYRADLRTRTIDIHIQRVRERLGPSGALIKTVRGIGYRLTQEPD